MAQINNNDHPKYSADFKLAMVNSNNELDSRSKLYKVLPTSTTGNSLLVAFWNGLGEKNVYINSTNTPITNLPISFGFGFVDIMRNGGAVTVIKLQSAKDISLSWIGVSVSGSDLNWIQISGNESGSGVISGTTNGVWKIWKRNGVCTLTLDTEFVLNTATGSWQVIQLGSVPAQFRPKENIYFGVTRNLTPIANCLGTITKDGDIQIFVRGGGLPASEDSMNFLSPTWITN